MVTYATCREWCVRACTDEKLLVSQSSEAFGMDSDVTPNDTERLDRMSKFYWCAKKKKKKKQVVNETDGNGV